MKGIVPRTPMPITGDETQKETRKRNWREKAYECKDEFNHDYRITSWLITERSKTASQLVCFKCFHEINMNEAFEFRN
jgi:hypothetical protein